MSLAVPTLAEKQFLAMMKACLDSGGVTPSFIIEAATIEVVRAREARMEKRPVDGAIPMLEGDDAFRKKLDDVIERGAKKISKLERKAGSVVKRKKK